VSINISRYKITDRPYQTSWRNSDGVTPCGGAKYRGINISRFSTNKSLYLANDTIAPHYGRRIGNRTQTFKWYQFQWPWVTCNSDFKVMNYSTPNNSKIKWYTVELGRYYNGGPIERSIYIVYRTAQSSWPWTTLNPVFKVTPFFNAEYLTNG